MDVPPMDERVDVTICSFYDRVIRHIQFQTGLSSSNNSASLFGQLRHPLDATWYKKYIFVVSSLSSVMRYKRRRRQEGESGRVAQSIFISPRYFDIVCLASSHTGQRYGNKLRVTINQALITRVRCTRNDEKEICRRWNRSI